MKIEYIGVYETYGRVQLKSNDGSETSIKLAEADRAQLMVLAYDIVNREKQRLADEILACERPCLPAPDCIDGEYNEVPF